MVRLMINVDKFELKPGLEKPKEPEPLVVIPKALLDDLVRAYDLSAELLQKIYIEGLDCCGTPDPYLELPDARRVLTRVEESVSKNDYSVIPKGNFYAPWHFHP